MININSILDEHWKILQGQGQGDYKDYYKDKKNVNIILTFIFTGMKAYVDNEILKWQNFKIHGYNLSKSLEANLYRMISFNIYKTGFTIGSYCIIVSKQTLSLESVKLNLKSTFW